MNPLRLLTLLTLLALTLTNQSQEHTSHIIHDCDPAHIKEELEREGHSHVDYSKGGENWQGHGGICEKHGFEAPDQSPIDITKDKIKKIPDDICDGDLDWHVKWDHTRFIVKNNCHGVTVYPVNSHEKELSSSRDSIAILKMENTPFEHEQYDKFCLAQFHFHWGTDSNVGSEHLIDGERFPLELHFVHYACHFGNFKKAQKRGHETAWEKLGDAEHTLAVIGVLFEETKDDNPAFEVLLNAKIAEKIQVCLNTQTVESDDISVLEELVPEGLEYDGYYAYKGGLTTSPCTDNVLWFIAKKRGYISAKQLKRFRSLFDDDCKHILRNWRNNIDNPNHVYSCGQDEGDGGDNGNESEHDDSRRDKGHKRKRKLKHKKKHRHHGI